MLNKVNIEKSHPLRELFKRAIEFGLNLSSSSKSDIIDYIEEQILCEFIHINNLCKLRDSSGKSLEDVAEMLAEGSMLLNEQSFQREFHVHKHIGDYTLFMLSMFPSALSMKKGKEFIMGEIVVPNASLSEHYMLQGQRSYRIASEFNNRELFGELSLNFSLYKNILGLVRIYLESVKSDEYLTAKDFMTGTA